MEETTKKRRLSANQRIFSLINDDEVEKQINRKLTGKRASLIVPVVSSKVPETPKTREVTRNSAPFTSPFKLADISRETLNDEELSKLYTETIRLAAAGKITQKNTWSINLIDYIDDLLSHEKKEADAKVTKSSTLFRKASNTLDASIKIYSSRVDSVHNEMFRVLGELSNHDADQKAEDPASKSDQEGADEKGKLKQKSKKKKTETLLKGEKKRAVCLGEEDYGYEVDPMFFKMSTAFDEGGARGLLLNNVSVGEDLQVIFDSDLPVHRPANLAAIVESPKEEQSSSADEGQVVEIKRLELKNLLSEVSAAVAGKSLCPLLSAFRGEISRVKREILSFKAQERDWEGLLSPEEKMAVVSEIETAENDVSGIGFENASQDFDTLTGVFGDADEEEKNGAFNARTDELGFDAFDSEDDPVAVENDEKVHEEEIERAEKKNAIVFTNERPPEDEEYMQLLDESLSNWAGPNFWNFNQRRLKRKAETQGNETLALGDGANEANGDKEGANTTMGGRRKKARAEVELIDLDQLLLTDFGEQKLKKGKILAEKKKTRRKKKQDPAVCTLPEDRHLTADMFLRPFLRPHLLARVGMPSASKIDPASSIEVVRSKRGLDESEGLPDGEELDVKWYNYENPNDLRYCGEFSDPARDAESEGPESGFGIAEGDFSHEGEITPDGEGDEKQGAKSSGWEFAKGLGIELSAAREDPHAELFDFNKISAEVNVRRLKNDLWDSLQSVALKTSRPKVAGFDEAPLTATALEGTKGLSLASVGGKSDPDNQSEATSDNTTPNEKDKAKVSFTATVQNMKKRNNALKAVSVQYCFVCLLHLANENELDIRGSASLSDFDVAIN